SQLFGDAEKVLSDTNALMHRPFQPFVQIPNLTMDKGAHWLERNTQPDVQAGVILRKLPLDLTEALPFLQQPGTTVPVPFETKEDGTLHADAEAGGKIEISVDNGPWQESVDVAAGKHIANIRSPSTETLRCSLFVVPRR